MSDEREQTEFERSMAKFGATVAGIDTCGDAQYRISPPATCIDHRVEGARLVIRENDASVDWGLFKWCMSDDEGDGYELVAHGWGISGSLREARHTYFGPDGSGYIFYVEPWVLAWAFAKLATYFDFQEPPQEAR